MKLLSPYALRDMTAEDFHNYVKGLYQIPVRRSALKKVKTQRELGYRAKITKKGKLSVTTRRRPKYVTEEEIKEIGKETGRFENEIFLELRAKGITVREHEE